MALSRATGWINTERSRTWLRANQKRFDLMHRRAYRTPAEVNNIGKAPILDQGQVGACSGFSDATIEGLLNLAATGKYASTSPGFNYITNQMADAGGKVPTEDTGATIAASAEARTTYGACQLETMPWTGKYDPSIPQAAFDEGKKHLMHSHSVLSSPDEIVQYIGTTGLVQIGIPVGQAFQNCKGIYSARNAQSDCRSPEGGHALAVVGYLLPATVQGFGLTVRSQRVHFIVQNSWTDQYGYNGYALFEYEAMAYLCSLINHGDTEVVGMAKEDPFGPDAIDWGHVYSDAA